MIYFLYPFYALLNLSMTLIAYIIGPILPLFTVQKEGWLDNHSVWGIGPRLPTWLNWFMTPDNSLDGDAGAVKRNGTGYLAKVLWLWRNPAYSVCLKYINTIENQSFVKGDDSIRDNDNAKAGWVFVRCAGLFQFTRITPSGNDRCWYFNFGWNIRGTLHTDPTENYQATFALTIRKSGFR